MTVIAHIVFNDFMILPMISKKLNKICIKNFLQSMEPKMFFHNIFDGAYR